ncbi:hypothetical protein F5884DRAFT_497569 [Xylogone sp. PMI_703]|nr:hypothetical protein F5884DRAFT_497569 [Xylogone sp. PMI_703]
MLEYFSYKKFKKHKEEKHASEHDHAEVAETSKAQHGSQAPVLTTEDENFLERIVSDEETPPPLPIRPSELTGDVSDNEAQVAAEEPSLEAKEEEKDKGKGKGKEIEHEKETKKANRFSFITRNLTRKGKTEELEPKLVVTPAEATKEEEDIRLVLEELNLHAVNNRAFSLSAESQELVQKFTLILKDLINGVPTAYDDLVRLLDTSNSSLSKTYESLPSFMRKLISQLPAKLTNNLAPEALALAAEGPAIASAGASEGLKGAAKKMWKQNSLKDLVGKPGAVVSLLKTIVNALKVRWPAFMGTNVLLSLALFVLLFVFWYCHKRGREVRLEREKSVNEGSAIEQDDDSRLNTREETREARSRSHSPALPPRPGTNHEISNQPDSNLRSRSRENEASR